MNFQFLLGCYIAEVRIAQRGDITFQFLLGCYRKYDRVGKWLLEIFQFLLGCYKGDEAPSPGAEPPTFNSFWDATG